MENGRLPIMALHSQVDGIRDRGKPTKAWTDNIIENIKAQGMDIREATGKRYQLRDFLLGPHRGQTRDGKENWNCNWISGTDSIQCYRTPYLEYFSYNITSRNACEWAVKRFKSISP